MANDMYSEKAYMERTHGPVSDAYYATHRPKTIGYTVLDKLDMGGAIVLDIGAFAGFVGNHCRLLGAKVVLLDIFSGAFPPSCFSVQGTNECMPFKDNSFDYVVCGDTLHHGDIIATVSEIYRVLKPGCRFVSVRELELFHHNTRLLAESQT